MKVLTVSALYPPRQVGGAEKIAQLTAEGLVQAGYDCVVATTMPASAGMGTERTRVNGVEVHSIGLRNIYWPHDRAERAAARKSLWHAVERYNPLMGHELAHVIDAVQPDVVHTHSLTGFSCAAWQAAQDRGVPVVHTLHDYSLLCPRTSMFRETGNCEGQCRVCAAYTAPARRISGKVDAVVGVSRFTLARHLECGYFAGAGLRRVIHNGIPPAASRVEAPVAARSEGPLRLGYVGQLVPAKGVQELMAQMRDWSPAQCELLVAGKGAADYEETLRAHAPSNVVMLGFVDPARVYERIDALVVPSLWEEPFGMIAIEAFAHGVPVIAARRGGLPEIVEDGFSGRLFDWDVPGSLHAVIDAFVRDRGQLRAMREHAFASQQRFTAARMQREYAALLEQVAASVSAC